MKKRIELNVGFGHFEEIENLDDLKKWVAGIEASVPLEYRDSLKFEYDSGYDFGPRLVVYYEREETDAERTTRERYALTQAEEEEADERRQYERLKAKFEGPKS